MEDLMILKTVQAAHTLKMEEYWQMMRWDEVEGFIQMIDANVLDEKEINEIGTSLQVIGGEIAEKIAETDNLSKDDATKELAVAEMIKAKEKKRLDFRKDDMTNGAIKLAIGIIVIIIALAFLSFLLKIEFRFLLVAMLVTGVALILFGLNGIVEAWISLDGIHEAAADDVDVEVKNKLIERRKNLASLYKIDQCIEVINSRR